MKFIHKYQKFLIVGGLFALIILSFTSGYYTRVISRSSQEVLLEKAYNIISNDSILNQQSDTELVYSAIRGMLGNISDPYAELIEPDAAGQFNSTFHGETGVVGLYAENLNDQVEISIVFPGGAAAEAGILPGDIILEVDQIKLDKDTDSSETGLLLRGEPGSTVRIKILRDTEVLDFDLVRQTQTYVASQMLPNNTGYLTLSAFNSTATEQLEETLKNLLAQNPVALIWDLRNNEGGDMLAAQDILSFFIEEGQLFSAELTNERTVQFTAKGDAIAADIPLVVLMDHTTYSAAETCASTIAETGRGTTIGTVSYGKGVIQATIDLQDDTLLQLTIARWKSYSGQWYQGTGVAPQIKVVDDPSTNDDELIQFALNYLIDQ